MPVDRARAIAEVAQVVVNSAKAEIEFLRVTDGVRGSGFIVDGERKPPFGLIEGGVQSSTTSTGKLRR